MFRYGHAHPDHRRGRLHRLARSRRGTRGRPQVRGLDSLAPAVHDVRPYWPDEAELVVGDVRDPLAVDKALDGVDAVCHQAALVGLGVDLSDLPAYSDVNVTGTAVLLEAMGRREIPRLVLASSMVVYGEGGYDCPAHGPVRPLARAQQDLARGRFEPRCPDCALRTAHSAMVTESAPLDPRNAYAVSKVAQEQLAAVWAGMTGGLAVALRYHNVYGPRMPRDTPYSGVAAIFRSALEALAPSVFEDGAQQRDFVHAADVAAANLSALAAWRARSPARLQHRQRRTTHDRPDGRSAGRGLRRP